MFHWQKTVKVALVKVQ